MLTLTSIIYLIVFIASVYTIYRIARNANSNVITLYLDEMYKNTNEMASAVFEELNKEGRECELIEVGRGYPKFLVDGKKYFMTYKMASIAGVPMQVIQLKLLIE